MLELHRIQTTRLISEEDGGSPLVLLPQHPEVPRIWHVQAVSARSGYVYCIQCRRARMALQCSHVYVSACLQVCVCVCVCVCMYE